MSIARQLGSRLALDIYCLLSPHQLSPLASLLAPSFFDIPPALFLIQKLTLRGLGIAQCLSQVTSLDIWTNSWSGFIDLLRCSGLDRLAHHQFFCPGHLPASSNFDRADQPVLNFFYFHQCYTVPRVSNPYSQETDLVTGSGFFVAGLYLDLGHQRRRARSHILGGAPCATITFALTVAATSRLCTASTWIGNRKMSH